ncbi:BAR-domain-containing protein [Trichodelitschia bisporula]|uniref:BAR-domain-containing protein n=1 Tax=Trichodelitschia bisporula TaxID=703511 RepID=A0A6G1I961_9PEZI|nr:BAR-domain-containing protein [Trichodelitschia bisporula]
MNVNKKLDRFKQWAGEKMGGEAKTNTSEDFKALEAEMNLRHEGMEKLQKAMTVYVKAISKRAEEGAEKILPVGFLGSTMISHGQDFQPDSEFGNCLISFGRANEAIARKQESYVAHATTSWLESLERSLAQMKEYQAARKKLEARRLAYDASLAKMQKAKKEDFRVEEELRAQKAKYEESSEDVFRRMMDIQEAEVDSVGDMTAFLDAELAYYDNCREVLLQLKRDWPGAYGRAESRDGRKVPVGRSRSNTAHSYADRFNPVEEEPAPVAKLTIPKLAPRSGSPSGRRDPPDGRPQFNRSVTEVSTPRDYSPIGTTRLGRIPTEPSTIMANRTALRPVRPVDDYGQDGGSGDRFSNANDRVDSPTTSYGGSSRTASWSTADNVSTDGRRKAPPPPPSRAKKPAPPPPMKRSTLNNTDFTQTR